MVCLSFFVDLYGLCVIIGYVVERLVCRFFRQELHRAEIKKQKEQQSEKRICKWIK